jgi:hypothetical protein
MHKEKSRVDHWDFLMDLQHQMRTFDFGSADEHLADQVVRLGRSRAQNDRKSMRQRGLDRKSRTFKHALVEAQRVEGKRRQRWQCFVCVQKQRHAEEERHAESDDELLPDTGSDDQQEAQAEPTSTAWFCPGCVEAMHPECFVRVASHELGGDVHIHVRQGPIKLCFNPHHHQHNYHHLHYQQHAHGKMYMALVQGI